MFRYQSLGSCSAEREECIFQMSLLLHGPSAPGRSCDRPKQSESLADHRWPVTGHCTLSGAGGSPCHFCARVVMTSGAEFALRPARLAPCGPKNNALWWAQASGTASCGFEVLCKLAGVRRRRVHAISPHHHPPCLPRARRTLSPRPRPAWAVRPTSALFPPMLASSGPPADRHLAASRWAL